MAALKTFKPPPTAIVNSGNGINVLWRIAEPIDIARFEPVKDKKGKWVLAPEAKALANDAEGRCKAIMEKLGSKAGTQNIDRILRLPGTINLPTPAKLKEGKVECPTSLVSFDGGAWALDDFPKLDSKTKPQAKEKTTNDRKPLPKILETLLKAPDNGAHEECGGYEDRSAALAGFIRNAFDAGLDVEDIIKRASDEKYKGRGIYEHCVENAKADIEQYIKGQIEKLLDEDEPTTNKKQKAISLPIRIRGGDRQGITDILERGLIKAKRPVYVRGGCLVEPLWRPEKTAEENRDTLVTKLLPLNEARLSYMVAKHVANFQKWIGGKKGDWAFVNPPNDSIEQLLALGHWIFPTVRGISNSPIMRRDGSLFDEPKSYDPRTQFWYMPTADLQLPPDMPKRPSPKQAQHALGTIRDLLSGFPFVQDDNSRSISESVAIAGLMTPPLRGAFEHTPGYLFLAPEAGTGKTYLVTTIAMIATGREPMAIVGCENKEEMEKRLQAAAFSAVPIVHLNNLSFNLKSDLLNQMITEGKVGIREFGQNTQVTECDCYGITVFANGNNIAIVGDTVRRFMTAHIDSQVEKPEEREFRFDPVDEVKKDRGKYLAAVYTIARAYIEAGCPPPNVQPLNGFKGWCRMIRNPLIWLGMPDPVESMKEARENDPERQVLRNRVFALLDIFGTEIPFTSADVLQRVQATTQGMGTSYVAKYPELKNAFEAKNVSSVSIGRLLTSHENRIAGGYQIVCVDHSNHGKLYKMKGEPREPKTEAM